MWEPRVSVIIPVFNRSLFAIRAFNSVLSQTYSEIEIIVVDDGSTENTDPLRSEVEDNGHVYIRSPVQRGVSFARNRGIEIASGSLISFLDSDDAWDRAKLETQVAFLEAHPQIRVAQSREIWFRHQRRVNQMKKHNMPTGNALEASLKMCCISPSSVILYRSVFGDCGVFDEKMRICEDYDLWLRVTSKYEVGLIEAQHVMKHGGHDDQLSHSEVAIDRFRVYSILKNLSLDVFPRDAREVALGCLANRSSVLFHGAIKRGVMDRAVVYRRIHAWATSQITGLGPEIDVDETRYLLEIASREIEAVEACL